MNGYHIHKWPVKNINTDKFYFIWHLCLATTEIVSFPAPNEKTCLQRQDSPWIGQKHVKNRKKNTFSCCIMDMLLSGNGVGNSCVQNSLLPATLKKMSQRVHSTITYEFCQANSLSKCHISMLARNICKVNVLMKSHHTAAIFQFHFKWVKGGGVSPLSGISVRSKSQYRSQEMESQNDAASCFAYFQRKWAISLAGLLE